MSPDFVQNRVMQGREYGFMEFACRYGRSRYSLAPGESLSQLPTGHTGMT